MKIVLVVCVFVAAAKAGFDCSDDYGCAPTCLAENRKLFEKCISGYSMVGPCSDCVMEVGRENKAVLGDDADGCIAIGNTGCLGKKKYECSSDVDCNKGCYCNRSKQPFKCMPNNTWGGGC